MSSQMDGFSWNSWPQEENKAFKKKEKVGSGKVVCVCVRVCIKEKFIMTPIVLNW